MSDSTPLNLRPEGAKVTVFPGACSAYPMGFKGVIKGVSDGLVIVQVTDPTPFPNTVRVHVEPDQLALNVQEKP